jgi:hypothetical protein
MKNHDEIWKLLPAYCGGELDPAERMRVEEHLASCPACSAALVDLETTLRLLRSTPQVEPPPWLTSRIMARLREESVEKRSWLQRFFFQPHRKLPLEIMALLVVCVSGYFLARNLETEMQQPIPQLRQPSSPALPPERPVLKDESRSGNRETVGNGEKQTASTESVREKTIDRPAPYLKTSPSPAPAGSASPVVPPAAESSAHQAPAASYAPPPPPSVRAQERIAPAPGPGFESNFSAPPMQSFDRSQDVEPFLRKNTAKRMEKQESESANTAGLPQLRIRISMDNPSGADGALRRAISRSGGAQMDVLPPSGRHLKARILAARLTELVERLDRLGKIAELPTLPDSEGMVVVDIVW